MNEQQLKEIFELLEKSGFNPMLCDTPVPYFENGVKAGIPADPGDIVKGDYVMLPRKLVGWRPVFVVNVKGDSMRDAGFSAGDRLQVQVVEEVDDGDIVVASIDGDFTVKAFCTDEQGQRWLVPCNDEYDAILLTEEMNVSIIGKVVGHTKEMPRATYRNCIKAIKRTQRGGNSKTVISRQRIEETIRVVAQHVENKRQWYAVYRAMLDRNAIGDDYYGFVELVTGLVPEHGHQPVVAELRRIAVQSFRKPVALWNRDDAPVAGQRYDDYLRIARLTGEMLTKGVK